MTQTNPDTTDFKGLVERAGTARQAGDVARAARYLKAATVFCPDLPVGYVNLMGTSMAGGLLEDEAWSRALLTRMRTLAVNDARVARNLAVVATHASLPDLAEFYLHRAMLFEPADPTVWRLMVDHASMPTVGRRVAVLLNPGNLDLLRSGVVRGAMQGDWDQVLSLIALAGNVDTTADASIVEFQAEALQATGQLPAAIEAVLLRLGEQPDSARLWCRYGVLLRSIGQTPDAVQSLRRASVLAPGYDIAPAALGRTELQLRHAARALQSIERALLLAPEPHGSLTKNRAAALVALRRGDEAQPILRQFLVSAPNDDGICLNLATGEMYRLDFNAAERWVGRALILAPHNKDALFNGALMARHMGNYQTAIDRLDAAIELDPDNATYRFNRASLQMQDGDRALGCPEYRFRHQVEEFSTPRRLNSESWLPLPVWDLSPATGKRLAIWGEQGIGDEIWFSQFLESIRDRIASVVLEVSGKLVPTMQRTYPWAEVVARGAPGSDEAMAGADLQLPIGDLIGMCEEVSPSSGHLRVNPGLVAAFRTRYERAFPSRRTIGISWRSVKIAAQLRSFEAPLEQWGPIFSMPNVEFISLQYTPDAADFATVSERFGKRLFADPKVNTVDDIGALAAQIMALDAVVSVANSTVAIAHGAGHRTYVPLRNLQDDFRYPHSADRSFWLPDVRFSWAPPPDRWEVALEELAATITQDWAETASATR